MEKILEYINRLNEVNTEGVEPLIYIHADGNNVFREDVIINGDEKDLMLKNAPCREEDVLVVPKTV